MSQDNSSKILKLATIPSKEDEQDTFVRNYDGSPMSVYNAPIIRALAKGLGVTFNIVIPKDDTFGIKKVDGNWTGIMGMLVKGEADLSVSGFTITKERVEAANFTYPLHVTDVTFMANKPEPQPKNFVIFDVYSFEIWIGIGVCLILLPLFLYILLERRINYFTILLESIGCLLEQSFSFGVKQRNTVLLLFSWFLGATVLTISYKAVILSVITLPRMIGVRDISDLSKAAKENSITCVSYKGGVSSVQWFESDDDRYISIGECLKRNVEKSIFSHTDFFKFPYKKAFIADRIDISKFNRDYLISDDSFSLSFVGLAYSKKFCYPKKLESVIHRIAAADLYPKILKDKEFTAQIRLSKSKTVDEGDTFNLPLTLKDFTGAFLILFIGHLSSLLLFMAEILSQMYGSNCTKYTNYA